MDSISSSSAIGQRDIEAEAAQASTQESRGFEIDLRAIWAALFRNRYLIAVTVGIALLLGAIVTLLMTPIYAATTTVQIDQQTTKVLGTEDNDPYVAADADRFLQTQLDILKSRSLAIRVAESLGLFRSDGFVMLMQEKLAEPVAGGRDARTLRRDQVIDLLQSNMSVNLPRNSRIASITFQSPDASLAPRIANAFAQNFITSNLKRRFDMSAYSRNFLQEQLEQARQRLEQSERAMVAYSRSRRLIDASAGVGAVSGQQQMTGPRSLVTSNLVQLNGSYASARSRRVEAQQRWDRARATPIMNLPEVLSNQAIQNLSLARAQLRSQYEQERQRHRDDYPTVQQAAANLAELDRQINQLATSIKNSIREEFEVASAQEKALEGNVNQLTSSTLTEQDVSIRYNILKRDADTNRALYDGLLQRYREVSAEAGVTSNNISIIDSADLPDTPVSPRLKLNILLAGVLGLGLAAALAFARERFSDPIRSGDDVKQKLGLPFLGAIPLLPAGEAPLEALADNRSSISEAYYSLRTAVELSSSTGVPPTLLLTSSRASEGKSTTSYALARNFAQAGKRVLLIDGDLRKPSLHRIVNVSNVGGGIASVLAQQAALADVIRPTEVPNLLFIPCGPLPPNPAELLSGQSLHATLAEAQRHFDIVVVDGPPVMGFADAQELAHAVSATLFVIEANGLNRAEVRAAVGRISSGSRMLGAVLTKFDARRSGYGYYYGYSAYNYGRSADARTASVPIE